VGQAVDEKKRQLELTREALSADLARAEARLRAELDWKARLRRDGPQIVAVVGVFLILTTTTLLLRRRIRGGRDATTQQRANDDLRHVTLRDLAIEVRSLREQLERNKDGKGKGGGPLWQKIAVGAAGAAASAGSRTAVKRLMDQGAEREANPDR
jgi:hypothetical protein